MSSSTAEVYPPSWNETPEEHFLTLPHDGRIKISYHTFGDSSDPCVLLLQDVGCPGLYWHHQFCHLIASQGFFVVRYDQRDTGRSSHFKDRRPSSTVRRTIPSLFHRVTGGRLSNILGGAPTPYNLHDLCRDAIGLLDALGVAVAHFVGYSLGGAVVQQILIDYPGRVSSATLLASLPPFGSAGQSTFLTRSPLLSRSMKVEEGARIFAETEVSFYQNTCGQYTFPLDSFKELALWSFDRHPPSPFAVERHLAAVTQASDRTDALSLLNPCCQRPGGAFRKGKASAFAPIALLNRLYRLLYSGGENGPRAILPSFTSSVVPSHGSPGVPPTSSRSSAGSTTAMAVERSLDFSEATAARPHIPVAIIHGACDQLVPLSVSEHLARLIPGAVLVIYPKMGHFISPELYGDIAADIVSITGGADRIHQAE